MAVGGISSPRVSYILAELEDVDAVFAPIKTANRVKYTCFDVSRRYIVFGTNAGGVVFLQHESLSYIKTVTTKEGPVCVVALSPDENVVAFGTSRGVTVVMEHNAERGVAQPQRLQISHEHRGCLVTAMQWNVSSSKIFVADDKGKVSVISVSTSRTRNIFQVPTTTLMRLDSKVIQLDFAQDHLLVSTLTRCYLCDTNKEQYLTIGKKLREGEYGACFYPGQRSVDPCTIYSARPGSRLWEVDIKGNVSCTHQFKTALAVKPEKLFTFRNEVNMDEVVEEYQPQATNFQKILLVWASSEDAPFVFTWSPQGVYIFDPKRAEVILWCEDIKGIKDVRCLKTDIYVQFTDGRFFKYSLMSVEQGVCRLYQQGLAIHGAQLLLLKKSSLCTSRLNLYVPASFIVDMLQKASEMGKSYLFTGLTSVLNSLGLSPDKLSQSSRSSSAMSEPVRLNTGIYVVNKLMRDADDEATSPVCLTRWRSASPVYRRNSQSPHSSPSRSSDRAPYSPKSQRSVTVRESKYKSPVLIKTPDSTDSGASGKVSNLSDETQSSPSFKDSHTKENWQSCTHSSNTQKQDSIDSNNSENSSKIDENNVSKDILKERVNGSHDNSSPKVNGGECSSGSSAIPSFSLNLQDLSKHGNTGEKRVSFKSKLSSSLEDVSPTSKENGFTLNGVSNGRDSRYSPQFECPDSMYDEYKYTSIGLYGSMMLMPNLDMSLLFGSEADFQDIKQSLANKFSSGKSMIMKNLKGLEQRLMQDKPELLDVKPKSVEQPTSPGSHSETERSSSDFHATDRQFWSFLPAIDINELVETTKSVWASSRDLTVLCDKENLAKLLEKWVNSLHSAQISVIQAVVTFLQNYQNPGSHSYKDDDTLRSTCSLITSQESSPSENCEISERLEQEDPSISDSRSYDEDKHLESTHSLNVEISDSSTLRTESVLGKLVNLEDFVFVYNPFKVSSEDFRMMSELAFMCFQLKILGKIDKVMEVRNTFMKVKERIEELQKASERKEPVNSSSFHQDLSENLKPTVPLKHSESAQSFHKAHHTHSSNDTMFLKKPLSFQTSDPSNIIQNGNTSGNAHTTIREIPFYSDSDDSRLASFLQNYFHFFDVQKLRELLNVLDEPCIKTWTIMLSGVASLNGSDEFTRKLAAEQLDAAANCLERNFFGPILIAHLLKVFKVNSSRGIDLCLQRSYHITSLDVLYLSKSSEIHPKPFLQYISRVLDCLPQLQRPKVLEKLLHLSEVQVEWINGAIQVESDVTKSLKCNCGWPRPGSHFFPWIYSDLLLHMLSASKDLYKEYLDKCFLYGFWNGYLLLSKKLLLKDTHRDMIINLSDVSLLKDDSELGYLPSSPEEWKEFFILYSKSAIVPEKMTCLNCSEQYDLCTPFYKSSNDSKPWTSSLQWEAISKVALAHMDSFKARLIFQKEKEKPVIFEKQTPPDKSSRTSCSYLEEPQNRWGVKISLKSVCKVCKIPLTSHLSPSQGGVTIYRCGHSYHSACSSEGFCITCLHCHDNDG
ncbi:hypothetical protein JTE90_002402 [Oedothorax gibbosus]|uniref:Hermansky-Pudlak syndrome 5 protein homolog n=1 Tax=Oedothorax gibbosus TaxID=931172 RepID=A0AAV6UI53_9ARAC|nr:hypothetical protein JTE90_002402 [Oedothorax gibbosus]